MRTNVRGTTNSNPQAGRVLLPKTLGTCVLNAGPNPCNSCDNQAEPQEDDAGESTEVQSIAT